MYRAKLAVKKKKMLAPVPSDGQSSRALSPAEVNGEVEKPPEKIVFDDMRTIRMRTMDILDSAECAHDPKTQLMAIHQARENLKLIHEAEKEGVENKKGRVQFVVNFLPIASKDDDTHS